MKDLRAGAVKECSSVIRLEILRGPVRMMYSSWNPKLIPYNSLKVIKIMHIGGFAVRYQLYI
jgi:hypothetical protein